MKLFKHSGDLGDLIYALPTIRALGGGSLRLSLWHREDMLALQARGFPSHRYPTGHLKYDGTEAGMTSKGLAAVLPLLKLQAYLSEIRIWDGEPVDYDLNEWRIQKINYFAKNLCASYASRFSVPEEGWKEAWLRAEPPAILPGKDVIFARSLRYRNERFPWKDLVEKFRARASFVGYREEWEDFVSRFGRIAYHPTEDLLAMARVIAGCQLFVGNQSLPYAIAEGLKRRCWQETSRWVPNCLFPREGARYFVVGFWTRRPERHLRWMLLSQRLDRVVGERLRKFPRRARHLVFRARGLGYSVGNSRALHRLLEEVKRREDFPFEACAFHSQGIASGYYYHPFNYRLWSSLQDLFFSRPAPAALVSSLTILTCGNRPEAGSLERSLAHLGWDPQRFVKLGSGVHPWSNLRKIALIDEFLKKARTPYVLYADSHDVLLTDPVELVARFERMGCDMLCNAEKTICYPGNYRKREERKMAAAEQGSRGGPPTPYVYLNAGLWIAKTSFARDFFAACARSVPLPAFPTDDQNVLKRLYPVFFPRLKIDIHRRIFQTLQFAKLEELRLRKPGPRSPGAGE